MRLVFISLMGGQPWGGSEALWKLTALEALKQGHDVFVSVYGWGKNTSSHILELEKEGAQIDYRKQWNVGENLFQKLRRHFARKFGNLSENWNKLLLFKPHSVFISQGGNFDLAMHHAELYFILKNKNIPYSFVCHSHEQFSSFPDNAWYKLAREVFINSRIVYFVSNRQWSLTERKLCLKLKNAAFTWNPLNLKSFEIIPWPVSDVVQMAIVGNLNSGKGHDTLFEVLSDEKWQKRNYQLNIYGNGSGETYLKELCDFFNLKDKIVFKGLVSSATDIWERNHILLIPSAGEGLPISLVEAAICGRPAVVTDVGGNTQIIEDNVTGFVACAPTVNSFAEALERAWLKRNDWMTIGKILRNKTTVDIDYKPQLNILSRLTSN